MNLKKNNIDNIKFVPIHFKYKRSHSFVKHFLFYSR